MRALSEKEKFYNRDLSWLAFNERVLEEAEDKQNPLLERVRFLAIFASNMDEFFMVRLASLKRLIVAEHKRPDFSGYYPQELLELLEAKIGELFDRLYQDFQKKTRGELVKQNIEMLNYEALNSHQKRYVKKFFETTLFPIITPMAIDQGRPFPVLASKSMVFAIELVRYSKSHFALVVVPKNTSRLLRLPSEKDSQQFILIEEVIRHHLDSFFRGFKVEDQFLFRVMRDSELLMEEEYVPNLLTAIEEEIKERATAPVVWLETEKKINEDILEVLVERLKVPRSECKSVDGPLDLTFLFSLILQVSKPSLEFPSFKPPKKKYDDIFERLQIGDMMLHLPYQSFDPTIDLIRDAANDPSVLAIKMTLYRTNDDSTIIEALKTAASSGKQVTVLVEVKARFDEERNIKWASVLENAGCHVMYGIAGMKIHAKLSLVVRKEEGRIRRYVHIGTGNYNEKTAKVYTDIGYMTCNDDVARDVSDVFNVITGFSVPGRLKRIVTSPNDMKGFLFRLIDNEILLQKKNQNGQIEAKMNSLEDPEVIDKLYEASQAGVKIRLLVRGICCLVPGVKGLSENIQVRSIVGRFLEHSRFFIFYNNSENRIFISSADWMRRNLDRRIETLFELYSADMKENITEIWQFLWKDNAKTRLLSSDGTYRSNPPGKRNYNAQEELIQFYQRSV